MDDIDWRSSGLAQPITTFGAEVLGRPCREVTLFNKQLQALVANMFATMYASQGVGVAANQVGVGRRVFVIDCPDDAGERVFGHVVNPVYRVLDATEVEGSEGCLSLPGPRASFTRPAVAEVTGVDVYGEPVRMEATGYAARCLQHETDHLDGRLYVDRLAEAERARVIAEFEASAAPTADRGSVASGSPFGGLR